MATSNASSSTSASRPRRRSPSWRVLASVLVSPPVPPHPRSRTHADRRGAAYTISRAILSDAIALTRGDRYFTADYTPFNLTCWGFADCQRDPSAPGCGSALGRLFLRTLPEQFSADSTFTWFPLMTPEAMDKILTKLDQKSIYSLSAPSVARPTPEVSTYRDVSQALLSDNFSVRYSDRAARVISGAG